MKQFRLLVVILAVILALAPVLPVSASSQANVVVTATGAYLNITVTPTTYDFGTVDAGGTYDSPQQNFSVNNTSTVIINVLIQAATWTSSGSAWTYGAAAADTAKLAASDGDNAFDVDIAAAATSYNLTDALGATTNSTFELRLLAPTGFSDGAQNSSNITLIAYRV